jgi:ribosomal-protein-alanine N-acetyltransferase
MTPVLLWRMTVDHVGAVRRLERRCFGSNMGPPALLRAFLAYPAAAGAVAETAPDGRLVGYLLYHLDAAAGEVRICQIAVARRWRRRRIGSRLLAWIDDGTLTGDSMRLRTGVNESNLVAQLFFRANGFRAVRILPGAAHGGAEDLYLFDYLP